MLATPVALADAPPFVSGRPGASESPVVVPKGYVQVETEIGSYAVSRSLGVKTEDFAGLGTSLRYGVADGVEIEAIVAPWLETRTTGASRSEGAGDATLRLRFAAPVIGDGKLAIAAIPFVTLPVGAREFTAGLAEFGAAFPLGYDLTDKVALSFTAAAQSIRESDGHGRAAFVSAVAGVSTQLTEAWGIYGEVFTGRSTEQKSHAESTADFGVTFLAAPTLQFDASVNLGLTRDAADRAFSIGIARRF